MAGRRESSRCLKIRKAPRRSPRSFPTAGYFFGFVVDGPGLRLGHNEGFAPHAEGNQRPQVDHAILSWGHLEHGQKVLLLRIVGQLPTAKVRLDATSARHRAHVAIGLSEVDGKDPSLRLVPQKVSRALAVDLVDGVLLGCLHRAV